MARQLRQPVNVGWAVPTKMKTTTQMGDPTAPNLPPKTLLAPFAIAIPLTCLWLAIASARTPIAQATNDRDRTNEAGLRLNPNSASWPDLTLLPGIGEVTANRIVTYREENQTNDGTPVFNRPSDLDNVHGIGPKTIERIEGFLEFGSN